MLVADITTRTKIMTAVTLNMKQLRKSILYRDVHFDIFQHCSLLSRPRGSFGSRDVAGAQHSEEQSAIEFSSLPCTFKNVTVPVVLDDNRRRRHHCPLFYEGENGDAVQGLSPFWGS